MASVLRIVSRSTRRVVIVPGGGAYADAVRASQGVQGFSDAEAHRRAILAMHRMGADMAHMQPKLVCVATLAEMHACWRRGAIPVWQPMRLILGDTRVPADWSITSDGIAARLAEHLGGAFVILVKSCRVGRSTRAGALAKALVIDPAFVRIVGRSGLNWRIVGPGENETLRRLVRGVCRD